MRDVTEAVSRQPSFRIAPWYTIVTAPLRFALTPLVAAWYRRATGSRSLKHLPVQSWKKGDTAFILGSGPTINDLTEVQWREISSGTSIGFNWWLRHSFVPDLYVFENIRDDHRRLLADRAVDYGDTPLILKQFLTNFSPRKHRRRRRLLLSLPDAVRENVYLASDLLIPGRSPKEFTRWVRVFNRIGLLRRSDTIQWLPKRTASLTFLVALCVRAGFKKVVLCGVDLNRRGYFFDLNHDTGRGDRGYGEKGGPPPTITTELHKTEDPAAKVIPISLAIESLVSEVVVPRGAKVLVSNPHSALSGTAPVFSWGESNAGQL